MKNITVNPDQIKSYFSASHAIEDLGYKSVGKVVDRLHLTGQKN